MACAGTRSVPDRVCRMVRRIAVARHSPVGGMLATVGRGRHHGHAGFAVKSCALGSHRQSSAFANEVSTVGVCDGACESLDAARMQHIGRDSLGYVHQTRNWHQTGTSQTQKAKKSAGANLLTLDLLGSPTWTRTRDLRINSQYKPDFLGRYGTSWDEIKTF